MFVETDKKFIESFAEIKNKKYVVFLYINVPDNVSFQEHCLQIWIILLGFRDTNDFVNLGTGLGICKHEFKFTCRGYCRFILRRLRSDLLNPKFGRQNQLFCD